MSVSVNNVVFKSGWNEEEAKYVNFAADGNKLINLQAGGTYNFTAQVYAWYLEQVRAWIDYNNDGVFDNATEQIVFAETFEDTIYNRTKVYAKFTIPPGAKTGQPLRMRVIEELSTWTPYGVTPIADGCFNPKYGQVEDYAVVISSPVPANMKNSTVVPIKKEAVPENAITITNNPFTDKFGIKIATPVQSKVNINLLDVTGKLVYTQHTEVSGNTTISVAPDTRKLLAGIYLVQVTINGKTAMRKIIKQ